jgi:hypothetical protein
MIHLQMTQILHLNMIIETLVSLVDHVNNILVPDETVTIGYSFYMARIDKIFLSKDGFFELKKGNLQKILLHQKLLVDHLQLQLSSINHICIMQLRESTVVLANIRDIQCLISLDWKIEFQILNSILNFHFLKQTLQT